MNIKEKILLVQLFLEDIRGNWGWENTRGEFCGRAIKARELCDVIAEESGNDDYHILGTRCNAYIASYFCDGDGRYFREEFPYGYENMESLHGLKQTFLDKSEEFKALAKQYLTHPECRFEDWDDYLEVDE